MVMDTQIADGTIVINLDHRQDRWEQFERTIKPRLGSIPVHRLSAVNGVEIPGYGAPPFFQGKTRDRTWAGRAGCVLSHRAALETAVQQRWTSVLILEDDIELQDSFPDLLMRLRETLAGVDWDVCYLGFSDPVGPYQKVCDLGDRNELFRIFGCSLTHAYLVRDRAYAFLLDQLPDERTIWRWLTRHRAIDRWYARELSTELRVLAVTPSVVLQGIDYSDITGRTGEEKQRTSLPDNAASSKFTTSARWWRKLRNMLEGIYDAARGWLKSRRGF